MAAFNYSNNILDIISYFKVRLSLKTIIIYTELRTKRPLHCTIFLLQNVNAKGLLCVSVHMQFMTENDLEV